MVLDPADLTAWIVDHGVLRGGNPMQPLPLPGGQPLLAWDARSGTLADPQATPEQPLRSHWTGLQAKTSEGWFAFLDGQTWVPASHVTNWSQPTDGVLPGPLGTYEEFERVAPLYVRGRVLDEEGRVLIEHVFGPAGLAEDAEARVALASVLNAPAMNVLSHVGALRGRGTTRYVAKGHNGSIVWWSAAIGLLAALLTARRMRRLRVDRSVAWTWTLGALLGGIGVLLTQWAYVRPRAWGDVPPHGHTRRRIPERASRLTSEAVS
ncbi:MAG: hypothetical protein R3F05_00245 [Planctomycetota bacterium]